jgi:hypothetical protein
MHCHGHLLNRNNGQKAVCGEFMPWQRKISVCSRQEVVEMEQYIDHQNLLLN